MLSCFSISGRLSISSLKSLKQNRIILVDSCLNILTLISMILVRILYWVPSKVPKDLVHTLTINIFDKERAYIATVFSKFWVIGSVPYCFMRRFAWSHFLQHPWWWTELPYQLIAKLLGLSLCLPASRGPRKKCRIGSSEGCSFHYSAVRWYWLLSSS